MTKNQSEYDEFFKDEKLLDDLFEEIREECDKLSSINSFDDPFYWDTDKKLIHTAAQLINSIISLRKERYKKNVRNTS